jgi:hypothetical protein
MNDVLEFMKGIQNTSISILCDVYVYTKVGKEIVNSITHSISSNPITAAFFALLI